MKGIIEEEIEKVADRTGEYPRVIELTEKEFDILKREMEKEYQDVRRKDKDFSKFRGCNLKINRKLSKFRVL